MRHLVSLFLALLTLGMAACGGGSGGDPGNAGTVPSEDPEPALQALLNGRYDVYTVLGTTEFSHTVQVTVREGIADGVASLLLTGLVNVDGAVSSDGGELIFDIHPDRTIDFLAPILSRDPLYRGAITADGDVAVLASIVRFDVTLFGLPDVVGPPTVLILVRQGGSFTPSGFAAAFHAADFAREAGETVSKAGSMTVRSDGTVSAHYDAVNRGGPTVDRSGVPATGSYGMSRSGSFSLVLGTSETFGGLHHEGELLITAGGILDGDAPRLALHVIEGSGMGDADLAGEYYLVGFSFVAGPQIYRAVFGTARADGLGAVQLRYTLNEAATLSDRVRDGTYAVSSNGRLELETVTEKGMLGGLSPSGRFAVLGGGARDGDNAALYFLVRN